MYVVIFWRGKKGLAAFLSNVYMCINQLSAFEVYNRHVK